jgi:hypothetical protein
MLDLKHPLTAYVFEASRYEDQIRQRLVELRADASADLAAGGRDILNGPLRHLRRLLHEHFEDRPGIAAKLDAIESAIVDGRPVEEVWLAFLALDELSADTFGTGFI